MGKKKVTTKEATKTVAKLPAGKKAAVKAAGKAAAAAEKAPTTKESQFGRVGTASEMYKRVIMAGLSNAEARAAVAKELGPTAAGPETNAGWYRWWLKTNGFKNVPKSQRAHKGKK